MGSDVMQWGDLSFTDDVVSNYVGGLTPTTQNMDANAVKSAVNVRQVELFQAHYNYLNADDRIAAGVEYYRILSEQLEVEKAYEKFVSILAGADESKRNSVKTLKAVPNNRDCEMNAHTAFKQHGKFDANS